MRILKQYFSDHISRFLFRRGYVLFRVSETKHQKRAKQNFRNLSLAYEKLFGQIDGPCAIPPNDVRAELLMRQYGTPPSEAYYIIQALARTVSVPGDVCEFGVAQGELSAVLANEIISSDKCLHLFDSFEGLPSPGEKDVLMDDVLALGSMKAYTGQMASPEALVKDRLRAVDFPADRAVIHKGFFENLLDERADFPTKVSFAYVDFDFHDPIASTLEFLHEVTSKNSVIIVDDYDYFSTGAKEAVDSFLAANNAARKIYHVEIPEKDYAHCAILTRL